MANVSETIPEALQPEVDAALAWFNHSPEAEGHAFEVTGILDAEQSITSAAPRELRLVLCGGDTCQQRSFQVARAASGFDVSYANSVAPAADATHASDAKESPTPLQSELDPPPGPRRGWLDSVLGQHKFVVLVFYRGFW